MFQQELRGAKGGGGANFVNKPDTLRSNDSFEILFGLGSGRWKGLTNGLKGLKINGVPLENTDGSSNFENVAVIFADGNPLQQQQVDFKLGGGGATQQVGTQLTNPPSNSGPGAWVSGAVATQNADFIDLRFVVQTLFYQDEKSIRENTATVEIQMRPTNSSTWINIFTAPTSNTLTYDETGYSGPFGKIVYLARDAFNLNGVGFVASNNPNLVIRGKTNSPYVKELRIEVPKTGSYANVGWEVRARLIEKDTVDADKIQERRIIAFESITAIIKEPLGLDPAWAGQVWMQVIGKASEQFNGFPEIVGEFDTKICKTPPTTVWNPTTRQYTGTTWDGSYEEHFTTDPAWQIKEFVEDPIHGLAGLQPGSTVDKWDALEASKYYSELVPDGRGGTHPRFSLNLTINEAQDVNELMSYLAGAVNSYTEDVGDGLWRLKVDKPETPKALFTQDNIFGEFNYSHTDVDTRFNDWRGTFLNSEFDYSQDTARVFDQDDIDENGVRFTEIALVGCTNRQEALRRLMFRMRVALNEYKIVSFTTNRFGRYIGPLDTILVADGALNADHLVKSTSRLGSTSGTTATLMRPVRLEVGVNYVIKFTTKDKQVITRTVTNTSGQRGDVTAIQIDSALPNTVMAESAVALEAVGLPANPVSYRVVSVERTGEGEDDYTITASIIDSGKWNAMDNVSEQEIQDQVSSVEIDPPTVPVGGMFDVLSYATDYEVKRALQVNWDRPGSLFLDGFKVEYRINDGPWKLLADNLRDSVIELENPEDGVYDFSIIANDRRGIQSKPLIGRYEITGNRELQAPTHLRGTLAQRPAVAPYEGFRYTATDNGVPTTTVWEDGQWKPETNLVTKGSDIGVEDGATVGMTPAQRTELDGVQTDISDLFATYGSTANAATSAANAAQSAQDAADDAAQAELDRIAAQTAAGQASTSASNASTSESNASASASSASTSATQAASFRDTAEGHKNAAATSASNASTSESNASASASSASTSATQAAAYRDTAEGHKNAAASSASNASTSESNASASASSASTSATQAAAYRDTAEGHKNAAATSAANASGSEANADASEANALTYAGQSASYRDSAQSYAGQASASASNASASEASAANYATLSAQFTGAGNLVGNSEFALNLDGWMIGGIGGAPVTFGRDAPSDDWRPFEEHVLGCNQQGPIAGGNSAYAAYAGYRVPVEVGKYYQVSAWIAAHRCTAFMQIEFYDENGGGLGSVDVQYSPDAGPNNGGHNPNNWTRVGTGAVQAPLGTAYAHVTMIKRNTYAGEADSWAWLWRPQLSEVRQGQTSLNKYTPGGSRNAALKLSADIVNEQSVRASADSSQVSSLNTLTARVQTRPNLIKNPSGADGVNGWNKAGAKTVFGVEGSYGEGPYFQALDYSNADGQAVYFQDINMLAVASALSFQVEIFSNGAGTGDGRVRAYVQFFNASDQSIGYGAVFEHPHNQGGWFTYKQENFIVPAGCAKVRVVFDQWGPGVYSGNNAAWRRMKLELSSVCTAYTDDMTAKQFSASILTNSSALATAQSQAATFEQRLLAGSPNLLPNSSFESGFTKWYTNGQVEAIISATWGKVAQGYNWTGNGETVVLESHKIPVYGGHTVSYSADLLCFADTGAAYAYVDCIFYDANNQFCGDGPQAGLYANADFSTSSDRRLAYGQQGVAVPANASYAAVRLVCNPAGGTISTVGIRQIKLEYGGLITPYTAEATANYQAGVISDHTGKLQSYLTLSTSAGAAAAAVKLVSVDNGGNTTSSVGLEAQEVVITNAQGTNKKVALKIANGNATFGGDVVFGGKLLFTNGLQMNVAVKPYVMQVSDGQSISFPNAGYLPLASFTPVGLAALGSGETYNLYLENQTASGATVRLKINTPGTPVNQSVTNDTSGPTWEREISKEGKPDATNNTYQVYGTYTASAAAVFEEPGLYSATFMVEIDIYAKVGGNWQAVGQLSYNPYQTYSTGGTKTHTENFSATFGCPTGVTDFGFNDDSGNCTVTDISYVSWQSPGSGSGTRTASPNGETCQMTLTY